MVKQGITIYGIVIGEEFETIFMILVIADTPKYLCQQACFAQQTLSQ